MGEKTEEGWGGGEEGRGVVGRRDGEWQLDGWNCGQKGGQRDGWKDGGRVEERERGWMAGWTEEWVEALKTVFTGARLVCSGHRAPTPALCSVLVLCQSIRSH